MGKLKKIERQQLLTGLNILHGQNINYITRMENGLSKKKYTKATIMKFKKRNAELYDYITEIENGADCTRTLNEWCSIFGDILANSFDDIWVVDNGSH